MPSVRIVIENKTGRILPEYADTIQQVINNLETNGAMATELVQAKSAV
jgi:hypothetical protein